MYSETPPKRKHAPQDQEENVEPRSTPTINVNIDNTNLQQQTVLAGGWDGGQRLSTNLSIGDVIVHVLLWAIISIFTLGIGLLFWPYAQVKMVLNSIEVGNQRVQCELDLGKQIGHIILWAILIVLSLGLAAPFYIIGVIRTAINSSRLV